MRIVAESLGIVGVVHGFTTRHGGVSPAPRHSLDLGNVRTTAEERRENWRRALSPDASPDQLALVSQVHGAGVVVAEAAGGPDHLLGEADAVISTTPGVIVAVRIADCVPILLAAEDGPPVVAAIHAGWRGVAADVVGAAVAAVRQRNPHGRLRAAVGPRIGVDRYEVGGEVVDGLRAAGVPDAAFLASRGDRVHVDLGRAVAHQLERRGVAQVELLDRCTSAEAFYSHRFDGPETGRQAAWIGLVG